MVRVRRAVLSDSDQIARLTADVQRLHNEAMPDLFKPPSDALFPPARLAQILGSTDATVAVAELDGGELVGCVYFDVKERPDSAFRRGETCVYVHQIAVRGDARRKGVGTALIAFVQEEAGKASASAIQLDHWAFNAPARSFFERCGFEPTQIMMRKNVASGK